MLLDVRCAKERSDRTHSHFEIMAMTRELEAIIASGIEESKIADEAKRQGMITMRQDGILKAWLVWSV